jgi:hypothetical protein
VCLGRWWVLWALVTVIGGLGTCIGAIVGLIETISSTTGRSVREVLHGPTATPAPFLVPSATSFTTPAAQGESLLIMTRFLDDSEARNLDVR